MKRLLSAILLFSPIYAFAGNDSCLVSYSHPGQVDPGEAFTVQISWDNCGTTTWDPDIPTNLYDVGSQSPQDNMRWGTHRWFFPDAIPPGGNLTITLDLIAPTDPGTYAADFKLAEEVIEWFGDTASAQIEVEGQAPPPEPSLQPRYTPTGNIDTDDLVSLEMYTGPYSASSGSVVVHEQVWQNDTGCELEIDRVHLWSGAYATTVLDQYLVLRRIEDNSYIAVLAFDRYAEPNGLIQSDIVFDTKPKIHIGEGLKLEYFSNYFSFEGTGTPKGDHRALIWFRFISC